VPVVLIDANIEGQGIRIWTRMQSSEWRELTASLEVSFQTFHDVGLDLASPDDVIWRFCQTHGYYLLTSNRNQASEDSLEATLRREGTSTSLPVFTLPSADSVYSDATFLERVVEKLLDFMLYADNVRGAGRLYLP
jgi:hypothetical protein